MEKTGCLDFVESPGATEPVAGKERGVSVTVKSDWNIKKKNLRNGKKGKKGLMAPTGFIS